MPLTRALKTSRKMSFPQAIFQHANTRSYKNRVILPFSRKFSPFYSFPQGAFSRKSTSSHRVIFIHNTGKVFPHVFPFSLRKNKRRKIQSLQGIFGFSHVSTGTTPITATIFKLFCSLKNAEKEKAFVFREKVENVKFNGRSKLIRKRFSF